MITKGVKYCKQDYTPHNPLIIILLKILVAAMVIVKVGHHIQDLFVNLIFQKRKMKLFLTLHKKLIYNKCDNK